MHRLALLQDYLVALDRVREASHFLPPPGVELLDDSILFFRIEGGEGPGEGAVEARSSVVCWLMDSFE